MKKCVILSMDNPEGLGVYDDLLVEPLNAAGWAVDTLSWRAKVNWDDYLLVMIRSPWDYQTASSEFLAVLEEIEQSKAHLDNPLAVVQWNIDKAYLKSLSDKGVMTIPTVWKTDFAPEDLNGFFTSLNTDEIVIKPCISAGAYDTYRLNREAAAQMAQELSEKFKRRDFMVQPFIQEIIEEGEYSLFYFDDEYSHAILKTPKTGDFRVQEEWGGQLQKIAPEPSLLEAADKALKAIDQSLLYNRLDFVRTKNGFALIEAELIEPSLYFNLDPQSPQRFVDAVERRMKRLGVII